MKTINGWEVFEENDQLPSLPASLIYQLSAASRFGLKIRQVDGKPVWEAVTEQDYRNSEAQRLGVKPEDIALSCNNTEPCLCVNSCITSASCRLVYYRTSGIYYCGRN